MTTSAFDTVFIQEATQGIIIDKYITFATLTLLVYDIGKPYR